jgi:AcrR family transcriptional regulator
MARLSLEQRRWQFINATIEVVANEGVARATTRRIAEVAHAPAASLHYCFHTKEDLLQAVLETSSTAGTQSAGREIRPGMGLARAVEVVMRGYAEWMIANRNMQQAQFELLHWALRSPASRHLPDVAYRVYIDATAELLRKARRDDEAGIDLEMLSRRIVALMDGHGLQWLAMNDDGFAGAIDDAIAEVQSALDARSS